MCKEAIRANMFWMNDMTCPMICPLVSPGIVNRDATNYNSFLISSNCN